MALLRGVRLWLRRTPLVRAGKAALHIATHPPPPAIVRRLLHAVVFPIVFGGPRPPVRVLPALGDALAGTVRRESLDMPATMKSTGPEP